jgi:hypothetical protein
METSNVHWTGAMMMAACGGGSIGEPEGSTNGSGEDTVLGLLLDETPTP